MLRPQVLYHFEDNNGKRAQLRFTYGPGALESEGARAALSTLAAALQGISSARLTHYEVVYRSGALSGPPAAPASDCFRRVSLFYRNGERSGSISIPSFMALPTDADGPYAAIRVTREALLLSGLLGDVQDIVSGTLLPNGEAFPSTFVVGGTTGRAE